MAERLYQFGDIGDELVERVVGDADGSVRLAVSAHFGRDAIEAIGQRADLIAPRVPAFGEAVQHDDRRAGAGACDAESDSALELDFFEVPGVGHWGMLSQRECGTSTTSALTPSQRGKE